MPGIVGVATASSDAPAPPSIQDMIAPMQRRSWYALETIEHPNVSCASITIAETDALAKNENTVLALDGRVFSDDGPIGASALLAAYQAEGIGTLQGLNGSYNIVVFDGTTNTLTITTDRLGYRPFYYTLLNERIYFASEYKAFYAIDGFAPQLSTQGLAQYLQLTYVFSENTLLENVHQIAPGSTLSWNGSSVQTAAYESISLDRKRNADRPIDDFAEEYHQLIRASVRRRMGDKNILLLTGGLDSRCLGGVLATMTNPRDVFSCTMGYERSYDVRFGAKLARTLGFEHEHINIAESYMTDYLDAGIERLEGNLSAHGYWAFAADDAFEKRRVGTVIHGLLGDSLAGERALRDRAIVDGLDEAGKRRHVYESYYATTFADADLKSLLKPKWHDDTLETTWNTFNGLMESAQGEEFFDRVEYLDLRQRQRHFTSQQVNIYNDIAYGETPFADRAIIDFALKLPQSMRMDKTMYKHMIRTRLPEVSTVPYTATGLPLDGAPLSTLMWRARNFFHYKILPAASLGIIPHVHYGVWIQYDRWLREASQEAARSLLADGQYLEDYFEMDEVKRWVDDHMSGDHNYYGQLCILMTFAKWRKRYNA